MTKYENLINKADLCACAALRCADDMAEIWGKKAFDLYEKARSLTVQEAEEVVR